MCFGVIRCENVCLLVLWGVPGTKGVLLVWWSLPECLVSDVEKIFFAFFPNFSKCSEMVGNVWECCFMMLLGLVWRDIAYLFELEASGAFVMEAC